MTAAQTRILEMFRELSADEREELLPYLANSVGPDLDFDDLSEAEKAAIEEGLEQIRRGEVVSADEVMDRLAKKFGFARA